jgi:hypothetical protein
VRSSLAEAESGGKEVSVVNPAAKSPQPRPAPGRDQQEAIRRRAEEIYIRNGRVADHDWKNWVQAEQEIMAESARPTTRKAIVVKVNGEQYIGEYNQRSSEGYVPGEFGPGDSVTIRFRGDKMLVLRPTGKVLETTLVKEAG